MRLTLDARFPETVRTLRVAAIATLTLAAAHLRAATWYIAPTGSDNNAGTLAAPFASITQAQAAASAGDTVYLRGGTYTSFTIASSDSNYNYVHNLTKSGISYLAYPGDPRPVFDFSSVSASQLRVCAFLLTGSNNVFDGFDITGVQVGNQGQSECWRINAGDGNVLRRLVMRDCAGIGVYIQRTASNTLVENCDAHDLVGVSGVSAGNIDGFGCHSSGAGNTFRYCRAWHCSDDGYDTINAAGAVTFDHCWAYDNGVNGGNANGFKVGGWGCSGGTMPAVIPVHTVQFCLAANNGSHGFYANHQPGQAANWYNNTAYNNAVANFDMLEGNDNASQCSVPGTREVLHNNLAHVGTAVSNLNESGAIVSNNSWTLGVTVSDADFVSLDATQLTLPRKADGSLPDITFMQLASGSDLIDQGMNVGQPFNGNAPDLGCFESGNGTPPPPPPSTPTGLGATTVSSTQIDLAWNAASGATSYNAKRSTVNGGPYATFASGVTATTLSSGGLASSTTYYFVVSAVNASGESADSAPATATTLPDPAPAAPGNLAATAGKRKISLSWSDNSNNETGFKVERSTDNATFAQVAAVGAGVTTYTNSSLTSGTTYYFRVRAYNGTGDSTYSNTASAKAK